VGHHGHGLSVGISAGATKIGLPLRFETSRQLRDPGASARSAAFARKREHAAPWCVSPASARTRHFDRVSAVSRCAPAQCWQKDHHMVIIPDWRPKRLHGNDPIKRFAQPVPYQGSEE
jgi:hypothetical protein